MYNVHFILNLTYTDFIDYISEILKNPKIKLKISHIISETLYSSIVSKKHFIYFIIIISFLPLFLLTNKIIQYFTFLRNEIFKLIDDIKITFKTDSKYIYLLWATCLLYSSYYAITYPITLDEVWNFNYFVRNNFFITQFIFNTGIIATHTASLLYNIGFSPDISIRLPVLLFHFFTIPIYYVKLKEHFKSAYYPLFITFLLTSPALVLYTVWGRQYIYLIFCIFLLFFLVYKILKYKLSKRYTLLLFTISVFGLYSSILFAIPLFIALIFVFIENYYPKTSLILIVKYAISIAFIVIIMYGIPFCIEFIKLENKNNLPDYYTFLSFLTYHYRYIGAPINGNIYFLTVLLLLIFNFIFIYKNNMKNDTKWHIFLLINFLFPLILFPFKITLAERLSFNTLIAACLIIFHFFEFYLSKFFKELNYCIFLIFTLIFLFRFELFFEKKFGVRYAKAAKDISTYCLENNIDTIFNNHTMIDANLIYYFYNKNKNVVIQNNIPESIYYKGFSIDTIQPKCISIIKKKKINIPNNYKLKYENEVLLMYVRN